MINSQHHKAGPFDMSPAYGEGKVFVLGMSGWLYAFDAATGKPLWEAKSELDYSNALLVSGGVVVAPAQNQWGGYQRLLRAVFHVLYPWRNSPV
jgi:outer membrane protein assembly factor BamB